MYIKTSFGALHSDKKVIFNGNHSIELDPVCCLTLKDTYTHTKYLDGEEEEGR